MKTTMTIEVPPAFTPFGLTIEFESQNEVEGFYALLNYVYTLNAAETVWPGTREAARLIRGVLARKAEGYVRGWSRYSGLLEKRSY